PPHAFGGGRIEPPQVLIGMTRQRVGGGQRLVAPSERGEHADSVELEIALDRSAEHGRRAESLLDQRQGTVRLSEEKRSGEEELVEFRDLLQLRVERAEPANLLLAIEHPGVIEPKRTVGARRRVLQQVADQRVGQRVPLSVRVWQSVALGETNNRADGI